MTRTTDDLQPTGPWRPLGERVTPPPPPPRDPQWKQVPGAAPGVEVDRDGRMRTNIPANDKAC